MWSNDKGDDLNMIEIPNSILFMGAVGFMIIGFGIKERCGILISGISILCSIALILGLLI